MSWLQSYGCSTTAGDTSAELWRALFDGADLARPYSRDENVKAFLFPDRTDSSVAHLLNSKLTLALAPVKDHLDLARTYGVILASTKGISDDFIWSAELSASAGDPLTPLLQQFLKTHDLQPARALCVSNACSSALAALALAQRWLRQGLDQVLVIAADAVTPFVLKGFQALKLIENGRPAPFSAQRGGFFLGEAAACLLLTSERRDSDWLLHPIGLDSDGSAVTRIVQSSASLVRAIRSIPRIYELLPQLVIAHGTGTPINDETEDVAFKQVFAQGTNPPWITGSKWCVGHTLATSAALDVIAAAEALERQQVFNLMTTMNADPTFSNRYLTYSVRGPQEFSRVLVSSLGFGGMHASALLERCAR